MKWKKNQEHYNSQLGSNRFVISRECGRWNVWIDIPEVGLCESKNSWQTLKSAKKDAEQIAKKIAENVLNAA